MITFITMVVLFVALPMAVSYRLANRKNRNWRLWLVLTFFLGWIGTLILALQTRKDAVVTY